jgi:hypothetical protein
MQLVEDPEDRFTKHRHRRHQPAGRGHPADPAGRPVARRRHQLLQGQRVARPGREPGRVPHQGRPGHGHRPAAPAQLGDPEITAQVSPAKDRPEGAAAPLPPRATAAGPDEILLSRVRLPRPHLHRVGVLPILICRQAQGADGAGATPTSMVADDRHAGRLHHVHHQRATPSDQTDIRLLQSMAGHLLQWTALLDLAGDRITHP